MGEIQKAIQRGRLQKRKHQHFAHWNIFLYVKESVKFPVLHDWDIGAPTEIAVCGFWLLESKVHLSQYYLRVQNQQVWLWLVKVQKSIYSHFWCRCVQILGCEYVLDLRLLGGRDLKASGLVAVYLAGIVWPRNHKDPFELLPWGLHNTLRLEGTVLRNLKLLGRSKMRGWCLDGGELIGVLPILFWSDDSDKCIDAVEES